MVNSDGSKNASSPKDQVEREIDINDLHPIELTAHTLLSGPLDSLNESFEQLNQSQVILLTRLKLIEERLMSFKKVVLEDQSIISEKELVSNFNKIRDLRKRLNVSLKTLSKVDSRIEKMNEKLQINESES